MRPIQAGQAVIMVFQAFIDESVSAPGGDFFVLAGHVATVEQWGKFSAEWERLLPWAKVGPSGERRFKMSEMGRSPQDIERVAAFYRVIEDNVTCSLSVTFRLSHLENAKRRVVIPGRKLNWGMVGNPYNLAFKILMANFAFNRHLLVKHIPEDARVNFVFDNRSEKKQLLPIWEDYVAGLASPYKERMGAAPKFEDEDVFLPLQAADLWAGACRRMAEDQFTGVQSDGFGQLVVKREFPTFEMMTTEDQMVDNFITGVHTDLPGVVVYDLDLSIPRPPGQ